jgi:methylenetetrahydrofolate--tRNA-(uracil-5-)-methyltransferase
MTPLTVIGAGLAGCEAAWRCAASGRDVILHEMRPATMTPAHATGLFGELVCSNSLRSDDPSTAVGTLKAELRRLGSIVLRVADETAVPAGRALAVDRTAFAERLTALVADHPRITIRRGEITAIPDGAVILASGPLTSPPLGRALEEIVGAERLNFFDAIAPILDAESIAPGKFFSASRYNEGDGDYLNIPLDHSAYERLIAELIAAPIATHLDEDRHFFEGCLPIEEMARRGAETPRFGPMKPVGLVDPATGERPHAVIQLRREDLTGRLYNMVGFQTQLAIPDQERIFRAIPGLEKAVFIRHGAAHRNTFLDAPRVLAPDLALKALPRLRVAGQLSGVEGYVESAASGLLAGLLATHPGLALPPPSTVIGGLVRHVTSSTTTPFQPMKANWGLTEELKAKKMEKKALLATRSREALEAWLRSVVETG